MQADDLNIGKPTPEELFSLMEVYHENSKLRSSNEELFQNIATVNSSQHIRRIISRPFRSYPGCPFVDLPAQFAPMTQSFEKIVASRRSEHNFSGQPVSLEDVARILILGDGIVSKLTDQDGAEFLLRTAPSGGGLYPIETYCIAFHVTGLAPGAYFYNTRQHRLEQVVGDPLRSQMCDATNLKTEVESAAFCIALAAVLPRSSFKYGQRAYRFVLLEAGHIAQNILLASEALGLGALPVGGFLDDETNAVLKLDGCQEFVVYLVLIGHHEDKDSLSGVP